MKIIEKIVISIVIFLVVLYFLGLLLIPFSSNETASNLDWAIAWLLMHSTYIFQWFIAPLLFITSIIFLLYVRLKHKEVNPRLYRNAKIVFIVSLLSMLYILALFIQAYVFNHHFGDKIIKEIEDNNFQIYKVTKLPPGYDIPIFSYVDDYYKANLEAKIEIYKNDNDYKNGNYWAMLIQKPMAKPNESTDCSGITKKDGSRLGGDNCYYLANTPGSLNVFVGRPKIYTENDIKHPYSYILASKNTTSFYLTSSDDDGYGFSDADLSTVYQILDSMQPVTNDELRDYRNAPLDKLIPIIR
jgi:hypothetical protein